MVHAYGMSSGCFLCFAAIVALRPVMGVSTASTTRTPTKSRRLVQYLMKNGDGGAMWVETELVGPQQLAETNKKGEPQEYKWVTREEALALYPDAVIAAAPRWDVSELSSSRKAALQRQSGYLDNYKQNPENLELTLKEESFADDRILGIYGQYVMVAVPTEQEQGNRAVEEVEEIEADNAFQMEEALLLKELDEVYEVVEDDSSFSQGTVTEARVNAEEVQTSSSEEADVVGAPKEKDSTKVNAEAVIIKEAEDASNLTISDAEWRDAIRAARKTAAAQSYPKRGLRRKKSVDHPAMSVFEITGVSTPSPQVRRSSFRSTSL